VTCRTRVIVGVYRHRPQTVTPLSWPDVPTSIAETRPHILHSDGLRRGNPASLSLDCLFILERVDEKYVELRGFEPLTSCMPYKFRLRLNVAARGSASYFNRLVSLGMAPNCSSLAPRFAPLSGFSWPRTALCQYAAVMVSNFVESGLPALAPPFAGCRCPGAGKTCQQQLSVVAHDEMRSRRSVLVTRCI
jgi:hypothetical protein